MTDPAVERCAGCNLTRVYCEAVRDMERRPCCDTCNHNTSDRSGEAEG